MYKKILLPAVFLLFALANIQPLKLCAAIRQAWKSGISSSWDVVYQITLKSADTPTHPDFLPGWKR